MDEQLRMLYVVALKYDRFSDVADLYYDAAKLKQAYKLGKLIEDLQYNYQLRCII